MEIEGPAIDEVTEIIKLMTPLPKLPKTKERLERDKAITLKHQEFQRKRQNKFEAKFARMVCRVHVC
jgi:hypothetical protein